MKTIIQTTLLTFIVAACSHNNGPMPTKILVGINDSAFYHIGEEGKIFGVQKKEYSTPGEMVWLTRDTIELGEEFYAHFGVYKDQFSIFINKPTLDTLTRADFDKLEKDRGLGYSYTTTEKGLFQFEGHIQFDTVARPFKWKFLVVESD
jgi:hypothetical protein